MFKSIDEIQGNIWFKCIPTKLSLAVNKEYIKNVNHRINGNAKLILIVLRWIRTAMIN